MNLGGLYTFEQNIFFQAHIFNGIRALNFTIVNTMLCATSGENKKKIGLISNLYIHFFLDAQNYNNPAFKTACTHEMYCHYKK